VAGQTPPAPGALPAPSETPSARFELSDLLPKSLQRTPILNFTVISEVTDAGKQLPPVTPDAPAYYTAYSAGFRQLGDTYYGEKTLTPESVEKILAKSLATNGYLPADSPAHPPSLLIIYSWGSHNRETGTESSTEIESNLLDSAALVGGDRFAQKLQQMIQMTNEMAGPASLVRFANPINLYREGSAKHNFMFDQAAGELYFVVASAYDYQSAASNHRVLLWRARMTVSSTGVNQEQTLPKLMASAAPYFGRDMAEPEVFRARRQEGTVTIGPLRVMDVDERPDAESSGAVRPDRPLVTPEQPVDGNPPPAPAR
jgi:hypothetical protein